MFILLQVRNIGTLVEVRTDQLTSSLATNGVIKHCNSLRALIPCKFVTWRRRTKLSRCITITDFYNVHYKKKCLSRKVCEQDRISDINTLVTPN